MPSNITKDDDKVGMIFDLMKNGTKQIKLSPDKDIILVLGNTGAGKSTVTQFLAGNNDDLKSVEVTKDSNEFIIIDKGERISHNSTIISKTLFPELIVNSKRRVAYYDFPGFSDTRSPAHEIAATYFVKKVIDTCNSVKLLLVVNYSSVRKGVDRKDFILLVKHVTNLIKDIDKFKDSIALIATKVDNTIYKKNHSYVLVPDNVIINTIADFLRSAQKDLNTQAESPGGFEKDQQFPKIASKFIDILLEKEGDNYTRIGIFRRPDEPGLISQSLLLQEGKKSLEIIVYNNIEYVEKSESDFGFTVSSDSLLYVGDLSDEINKSIAQEIILLGNKIIKYHENEKFKSIDLYYFHNRFKNIIYLFSKYAIQPTDESKVFLRKLKKIIYDLQVDIDSDNISNIQAYTNYLTFLSLVSGKTTENPLQWIERLLEIEKYFNNNFKYYEFLTTLQRTLSEYFVQNDLGKFNIPNLMPAENNVKEKLRDMLEQLKISKYFPHVVSLYADIEDMILNDKDISFLKKVLNSGLNYKLESFCAPGNKLIVRGNYVKLSDINFNACGNVIKSLEVFALHTIFIDIDFSSDEKFEMIIISPLWEIIGERRINLNGKAGEYQQKAFSIFSHDGIDGEPGLPGGAGGNFIGISENVQGGNLIITADGGAGGPGQDGGDGRQGKSGQNAPLSRSSATRTLFNEWGPEHDWNEENWAWKSNSEDNRVIVAWYYYTVYGKLGQQGGNGGDGGAGGIGGEPGFVRFIELVESGKVKLSTKKGNTGAGGRGGVGGRGGKHGFNRHVKCKAVRIVIVLITPTSCETTKLEDKGEAGSGASGWPGSNEMNRRNATKPLDVKRSSFIVNSYKEYVRNNLQNNILEFKYYNFLQKLENIEKVNDLYDTSGLVDDFRGLETQFYKFNENIKLLQFYESLLYRIENYAMKPKESENTFQYKKVLSYLYTALLSKIANTNNSYKQDLIVDVPKFIDIIIENIKELKTENNNVAINEYNTKFKGDIRIQIKKALDLLKVQIMPQINVTFHEIDGEIESLINEVTIMKQLANVEKEKLKLKKYKLEESILLKSIIQPLSFVSEFINMIIPIGDKIIPLLENGETILTEFIDEIKSNKELSPLISTISEWLLKLLENESVLGKDQLDLFGIQLSEIISVLKTYLTGVPNSEIKSIYENVKDIENNMHKNKTTTKMPGDFSVNVLKQKLQESIEEKKQVLANQTQIDDKQISNDMKIIHDIQDILNFNSIAPTLYLSAQKDKQKLNAIKETLRNLNDKIQAIEIFNKNIQTAIIPMCTNLDNFVQNATEDLISKNHFELDVRNWHIKTVINRIKLEISHLSKTLKSNSRLNNYFEKLSEVLSIIIDIYNRIEDYQDNARLADYIADITSETVMGIQMHDRNLNKALLDLDVKIKSNLILGQYDKAKNALAQLVFPFGNAYLDDYTLIPILNNTDTLLNGIVNNLEKIKNKLVESSVSIIEYDKYIHKNIKFNSKDFQPFYIWESYLNKNEINKLLEGEEITINADIRNGIDKNSVKFNQIGINFKSSNDTLQKLLDEDLQHFQVTMTHLGISYYKCDSKYYFITGDEQRFVYHLKKNENGDPVNRNEVYNKISRNEEILSPYTLWTIKLSTVNDHIISLEKYKNETINLELEGRGQYINRDEEDIEICENMEKFYNVDYTMSQFNEYYEPNEEDYLDMRTHRIPRSIEYSDDYDRHVIQSGSTMKSSAINSIMNSIVAGLSFVKFFNPINELKTLLSWENPPQSRNNFEREQFVHKVYLLPDKKMFEDENNSPNIIDNSSLTSPSNLLLWNVFLRKLRGVKAISKHFSRRSMDFENYKRESDYSQCLAYSYYRNKNRCSAPEGGNSLPSYTCYQTEQVVNQINIDETFVDSAESPYNNLDNIHLLG